MPRSWFAWFVGDRVVRCSGVCVVVCLVASVCTGSELEAQRVERILACASSDNSLVRRRACLALAVGGHTHEAVKGVLADGHGEALMPIKILGERSLASLYPYLLDPARRTRALLAIAMVADRGPGRTVPWNVLEAAAVKDHDLRRVIILLRAAGLTRQQAGRALGELEPIPRRLLRDSPECLVAPVIFDSSREWGLRMTRRCLAQELECLDPKERGRELRTCVLAMGAAARTGMVDADDLALLKRVITVTRSQKSPFHECASVFAPYVLCTEWVATGKPQAALDRTLQEIGKDTAQLDYEARFLDFFLTFVGETMLSDADIPMVLGRALDEGAGEDVRVGAIRVLSCVGCIDKRVHAAFAQLLVSKSKRIRRATAEAAACCLESEGSHRLHDAVTARLRNEPTEEVTRALGMAQSALDAF